jgi:hypothetical protein
MNREALTDEITLRRASIADARREFADGELSADALAELVTREELAIGHCEEAIKAEPAQSVLVESEPVATTARRHRRRYLLAALTCFAVVVTLILVGALSPRQPGNSFTGSITLTTDQKIARLLDEAEIDQRSPSGSALALAAYQQVLSLDPLNPIALLQSGWLSFSAGSVDANLPLIQLGESRVSTVVMAYPKFAAGRLYYAIIASSLPDHEALAKAALKRFLALSPSTALLKVARPWLEKYELPTS